MTSSNLKKTKKWKEESVCATPQTKIIALAKTLFEFKIVIDELATKSKLAILSTCTWARAETTYWIKAVNVPVWRNIRRTKKLYSIVSLNWRTLSKQWSVSLKSQELNLYECVSVTDLCFSHWLLSQTPDPPIKAMKGSLVLAALYMWDTQS